MTTLALAGRPLEFFFAQYRRVWRATLVSSVVTPVVYLLALGVGMGAFLGDITFRGNTYDYFEFVAPGLLAATAMQLASFEASWPVLSSIKWTRQYHAMLATPLRVRDVAIAHQVFIASRMFTTALIYFIVIAAFGAVSSPLGVLAIPVAVLVGLSVLDVHRRVGCPHRQRSLVRRDLPLRDPADVPLLGNVLSDRPPADGRSSSSRT